MRHLKITGTFLILAAALTAQAQNGESYYRLLLQRAQEQTAKRDETFKEATANAQTLTKYKEEKYRGLTELLGSNFKEVMQTKPRVSIIGNVKNNKNTVIRLIIDKRITANLYLPQNNQADKTPVVLFIPGHEEIGKATNSYQLTALTLANNGIAVLMADHISQGERMQMFTSDGLTANKKATTEHSLLEPGAIVAGSSLVREELEDNITLINVLYNNRIDGMTFDTKRIGVMGNSGGGAQASYLSAIDDRIGATCVCSWFTRRINMINKYGADDPCQWLPGEMSKGIEIADLLVMASPKPVMILAGSEDFIDFDGTKTAFNDLKKAYTTLNAKGKARLFTDKSTHGITEKKRDAAVKFFREQFGIKNKFLAESMQDIRPISARKLQSTPTGQILTTYGGITKSAQEKFGEMTLKNTDNSLTFRTRQESMNRLMLKAMLGLNIKATTAAQPKGGKAAEPIKPRTGNVKAEYIILADSGIYSQRALRLADELREGGAEVEVFEMAGTGSNNEDQARTNKKFANANYRTASLALLTGTSLVGIQTDELLTKFKAQENDFNVIAIGNANIAARHALYLYKGESRMKMLSYKETDGVTSWNDIPKSEGRDALGLVVPGASKLYDICDIDPTYKRAIQTVKPKAKPQPKVKKAPVVKPQMTKKEKKEKTTTTYILY